jgi:integrase
VSYKDLEAFFEVKAATHLSAAEQTIRWVSTVYNRANERLQLDALEANVEPALYRNPATIFAMKGHLRDRSELERDYELKGVRKPLSGNVKNFRKWLDYVLDARSRQTSRTAADYMLMTVIMGYRRMETKSLRWRHGMTDAEALKGNYVDLNERVVVLHETKNRYLHVLPIPDYIFGLLVERKGLVGKRTPWVFPAVSRSSLRKVEYYKDSRSFMQGLKVATEVLFSEHDLRRTFGNIVAQMKMPTTLAKQLLNHVQGDGATALYTKQSLEQLREVMNDIETEMLSHATRSPKGLSKAIDA